MIGHGHFGHGFRLERRALEGTPEGCSANVVADDRNVKGEGKSSISF
jgi:hypothetical protein